MDLSLLNPQVLFAKFCWYIVVALLFLVTGFYGGCQYKQNQWDAEKFKQLEKTTKQEHQDTVAGNETSRKFEQSEQQNRAGEDFVREELKKQKPLIKIIRGDGRIISPAGCVDSGNSKVEVITQPGTIKNEATNVYLTAQFMRLYDVSVQPGDSELRTRTYEESAGPSIDEGFEKVIKVNNIQYAACRLQLNTLIDRILEKQKIFIKE